MTAAGLVMGAAADVVLGDPRRGHPVAVFGQAAGVAEQRWHAPTRVRGVLHAVVAAGAVAAPVALLDRSLARSAHPTPAKLDPAGRSGLALAPTAAPALAASLGAFLRQTITRGHASPEHLVAVTSRKARPALGLGLDRRTGDGLVLDRRARRRSGRDRLARHLLTAVVTWAALGGRSLWAAGDALAERLEVGDVDGARALLPTLAGRDPSQLDLEGLARAGTESISENTSDAILATLVWGALLGPAGAAAHRAANTLDAMHGHRSARFERFGWAPARLDDLLGLIPARLGAWLSVALAPVVGGEPARTARTLRRDGRRHPSPNAGPMEAAFAGAIGVRLGGPLRYGDRAELRPVQNAAGRAPDAAGLRAAVRLSQAISLATLALAVATRTLLDRRATARRGGAASAVVAAAFPGAAPLSGANQVRSQHTPTPNAHR